MTEINQKNTHSTKRKTLEKFIVDARIIHGDKYLYDRSLYINNRKHMVIGCKKHGYYTQSPDQHLTSVGCKECGIEQRAAKRRKPVEKFIDEAKAVHGDRYRYDKVIYQNNHIDIVITCSIHGDFTQSPEVHLAGHNCRKCAGNDTSIIEEFITRARQVHGDTYLYDRAIYKSSSTKLSITCKIHGDFPQRPSSHLQGEGCSKCGHILKGLTIRKTTEEFIAQAKTIHGDKYSYDQVEYSGNKIKVKIICRTHGEFPQRPSHHLQGDGCPSCSSSHGETLLHQVLSGYGIKFTTQVAFEVNLKRKYDVYFSHYGRNFLVEFDGEQHFRENYFFHKSYDVFLRQQQVDYEKTLHAIKSGYCMIRIDHTQIKDIAVHLNQAILASKWLYLSNPGMYKYLTDYPDLAIYL